MVALASLWLPIVVSAVAVFVLSSIVWMVLPYHKTDWKGVANEPAFLEALRAQKLAGGMYMFPFCAPADMKKPEVKARFEQGPWGSITVLANKPNMGRSLPLWFCFIVVVAIFVAYVVGHFNGTGAEHKTIFRFATAMAWIVFGGSYLPTWIWEGKPGSYAAKGIFDGLLYSLVIGGVFASMWPHS
jgi:hypothetical protein